MKERISNVPGEQNTTAKTQAAPKTDINDPTALRALTRTKLVAILETAPITPALVAVCKELMDRVDGKPKERVEITNTVEHKVMMPATKAWAERLLAGGISGGTSLPVIIDNNDKSNS